MSPVVRFTISHKLMARCLLLRHPSTLLRLNSFTFTSCLLHTHESTYLSINCWTIELWHLFYFMHNFAPLEVFYVFSERMPPLEKLPICVKRNILATIF